MMLRITSGYFYVGVVIKEKAAPIIKYMLEWNENRIRFYYSQKGWIVEEIEEITANMVSSTISLSHYIKG